MEDERDIAILHEPVILDYINGRRIRTDHHLVLLQIYEGYTKMGAYDVWIRARDINHDKVKTFIFSRIRNVIDPGTGEVWDKPAEWFTRLVNRLDGRQPIEWPFKYVRTTTIPYKLPEKKGEYLPEFHYGVSIAHAVALDIYEITLSEQEQIELNKPATMTAGSPRRLSLARGDMFHGPRMSKDARKLPWIEQLNHITHTVQVKSAEPSDIGRPGQVIAELTDHASGNKTTQEFTQQQFEDFLRAGSPHSEQDRR